MSSVLRVINYLEFESVLIMASNMTLGDIKKQGLNLVDRSQKGWWHLLSEEKGGHLTTQFVVRSYEIFLTCSLVPIFFGLRSALGLSFS
ncbi:unnamed protein product [marine sediment metagenome]|uniref:Uncharacterized protein n=1 Tax=marine sediment metagenome TaxID=412755 RepID=X1F3C9_9ZZZZ